MKRKYKYISNSKNLKYKWRIEPLLSKMRKAIFEVRCNKKSSTYISRLYNIPARTLRRYVRFSKNINNELFFIKIKNEKKIKKKIKKIKKNHFISWKPKTAVPMFPIITYDDICEIVKLLAPDDELL